MRTLTPMTTGLTLALGVALSGCFTGDMQQNAGTGAVYTTRCSGRMIVKGDEYFVECSPPACAVRFDEVAENHVVVALDPGEMLVGYRERVCVQDLSKAAALFQPPAPQPSEATPSEEGAAPSDEAGTDE